MAIAPRMAGVWTTKFEVSITRCVYTRMVLGMVYRKVRMAMSRERDY